MSSEALTKLKHLKCKVFKANLATFCQLGEVRGDVLRPPHGTNTSSFSEEK